MNGKLLFRKRISSRSLKDHDTTEVMLKRLEEQMWSWCNMGFMLSKCFQCRRWHNLTANAVCLPSSSSESKTSFSPLLWSTFMATGPNPKPSCPDIPWIPFLSYTCTHHVELYHWACLLLGLYNFTFVSILLNRFPPFDSYCNLRLVASFFFPS